MINYLAANNISVINEVVRLHNKFNNFSNDLLKTKSWLIVQYCSELKDIYERDIGRLALDNIKFRIIFNRYFDWKVKIRDYKNISQSATSRVKTPITSTPSLKYFDLIQKLFNILSNRLSHITTDVNISLFSNIDLCQQ